ncbi:cell division ZapA family protein [Lysobacter concretionis Ko07 = DSM 16239]|uniref:Cell division protein ZapA n=1 Tax=Lysobacter concretionis Ko07 = DSM 16239 TaxID=1122185 RepID=A0A0A0EMG8_9GAMM|nr:MULTISPECIES: cell division protein ZapA [Lysobacter]KGM51594.1 cell division ZapA family protein [Lysobacter concretionis Ko07 = DSM 16239]QOD90688.1 cell division protein ZapA [Lysobacter sp. CW239]
MSANQPVVIRLLDREYTVGCEPDERDSLQAAAKLLDSKMREIRGGNRMAALDRVAVLAALNLAHELQQVRAENSGRDRELTRTLGDLNRKLDGLFDTASN